jgi:hypothetical protein
MRPQSYRSTIVDRESEIGSPGMGFVKENQTDPGLIGEWRCLERFNLTIAIHDRDHVSVIEIDCCLCFFIIFPHAQPLLGNLFVIQLQNLRADVNNDSHNGIQSENGF